MPSLILSDTMKQLRVRRSHGKAHRSSPGQFFNSKRLWNLSTILAMALMVGMLATEETKTTLVILSSAVFVVKDDEVVVERPTVVPTSSIIHPSRPRIMIADGCSGSTATLTLVIELMEAHGVHSFPMPYEYLKPEKNGVYLGLLHDKHANDTSDEWKSIYDQELLIEAIHKTNEQAQAKGQTLIFKADWGRIYNRPELVERLIQDFGAVFSATHRENVLDSCVCFVRDCFFPAPMQRKLGFPVDAQDGNQSNLCFERRQNKQLRTLAYLTDPVACVKNREWVANQITTAVRDWIQPSKMEPTESLFAFQYSNDTKTVMQSTHAWSEFLKSFLGSELNTTLIQQELQRRMATRPPPGPHETVIYNVEEVKMALSMTPYQGFFRGM